MRILIAIVFGCALVFGISQSTSSQAQPEPALTSPAAEDTTDGVLDDTETGYECKNKQYCQRASQCDAYCGGGGAVCQFGCCACAS